MTWKITKEVPEKERSTCDSFSKKLRIDKVEITDTETIAKTFNNFFVKIGAKSCIKNSKR